MNNETTLDSDDTNQFSFGECKICHKITGLKNGMCFKCNERAKDIEVPDFINDLFKGFEL